MSDWPNTIPLADAHTVRQMRKPQAIVWLEARYPHIPKVDIEAATTLCEAALPPSAAIVQSTPQLRNEFLCACYLLGGTLTQLALTLRISRGTAHQAIRRRMNANETGAHRRGYRLRLEAVEILWQVFQSTLRSTPTAFDGMSVFQLADFLEASVVFEEESDA